MNLEVFEYPEHQKGPELLQAIGLEESIETGLNGAGSCCRRSTVATKFSMAGAGQFCLFLSGLLRHVPNGQSIGILRAEQITLDCPGLRRFAHLLRDGRQLFGPEAVPRYNCFEQPLPFTVASRTQSNSSSSVVNRLVQSSGRMSSRGDDFLPAPFFIRYFSQDCTTFRPDTSNSYTSGTIGANSPLPTRGVRVSLSYSKVSG